MTAQPGFDLGFLYRESGGLAVVVRYIESCGKDAGVDRWRFYLYYEPHLAATHFERSAEAAEAFLARHKALTWAEYGAWRAAWEGRAA